MNDPRTGRWFSMDPVTRFSQSPFASMGNNPINMIDPFGAEEAEIQQTRNFSGRASFESLDELEVTAFESEDVGNLDASGFAEGQRLYSGIFDTGLIHHDGAFYNENDYDQMVQNLVDAYGQPELFRERLEPFLSSGSLDETFLEKYQETGENTYPTEEYVGAWRNEFINFGLVPNTLDVAIVGGLLGSGIKKGIAYFVGKNASKNNFVSYAVYQGFDKAGKVRYVGITKRNPLVRFSEHHSTIGTGKEFLDYKVIKGASSLTRKQARIFEQKLINKYRLKKKGGQLLNRRNEIDQKYWKELGIE